MNRSLIILLAAAATVAATPLTAAAQAWPATVVSGARTIAPARNLVLASAVVVPSLRALLLRDAGQTALPTAELKLRRTAATDEVPQVDIRAKDEWADDQGFRFTGSRVGFKRRF